MMGTIMRHLTIGKLAREVGVGVETVRYYERRGLLAEPPRKASGYRQYSADAVRSLRFIRRAKELGFSLAEVAELLALREAPEPACPDVKRQIATKIDDIGERIADLRRIRGALEELHSRCESTGSLGVCPILALLQEDTP